MENPKEKKKHRFLKAAIISLLIGYGILFLIELLPDPWTFFGGI
jgi:hypothetical protein